ITYTVVAKADGYTDSAAASYTYTPSVNPPQPTTLATPTGLAFSNGKLTWSPVKNATSYTVSDGNKSATVNTNSIDLAAKGLTVPTSGSITYTVVAKADGYNDSAKASYTYTPSENPPQPTTLATPTGLAFSNGKLTWSPVKNATSYTVSDGNKSATVSTNSIDLKAKGLTVPTSGSVTYKVIAKASGYNDSAAGSYKYTPSENPPQPTTLAMPVGLNVAGGSLSWSSVTNATSYTVSDGTKTVTVNTNTVDLAAEGFNVPDSGSVTYTVVAKASGYNDSPSASVTHQFQHTHTYNSTWESDETHHWNTINCGHSVISEESQGWGVHDFPDGGNTCLICSYVREMQELGKYVYDGEYPQTLKAENVTVGDTADGNGYYTGSDGARYAKVTAATISMGTWDPYKFSNDENITNGNTYYFKVEPIKWRVLENKDGVAFLLCDTILDHGAYYGSQDSREIGGVTA
ncbi:MAG: hypothetical protein K2L88_02670, partial [Clostridiales bacterium]|nr:hypothetical protein [Clostridiales bacterium]